MSNPYKPSAQVSPFYSEPRPQEGEVRGIARVYGVCNIALAVLSLLWTAMIVAVGMYGAFLSGDPPEEVMAGVLGCIVLVAPALIGSIIFTTAAYGLLRGRRWGFLLHIIGAVLAIFSCLGIIYTVIALVQANELRQQTP